MHVCICITVLPSASRGQQRESESGPLELDLWTIVSCHVGARHQTLVLYKNSS